jgi:hypothetical protein
MGIVWTFIVMVFPPVLHVAVGWICWGDVES